MKKKKNNSQEESADKAGSFIFLLSNFRRQIKCKIDIFPTLCWNYYDMVQVY
jgi:hypothetical protein